MIRYVVQLFASMGRHAGEAALAILIAGTVAVSYLGAGLNPPALQLVLAVVVLEFSIASWRLYRTQQVSIATTRSLRDLDALDRANTEQRLRAHYEQRERRLEQWHTAQIKRLSDDLADVSRELVRVQA